MNLRKRTAELLEQGVYEDRPSRLLNLFLILLISLNVVAIVRNGRFYSLSGLLDRHLQAESVE